MRREQGAEAGGARDDDGGRGLDVGEEDEQRDGEGAARAGLQGDGDAGEGHAHGEEHEGEERGED